MCDVECVRRKAAGGEGGAAGCNDKNPTIVSGGKKLTHDLLNYNLMLKQCRGKKHLGLGLASWPWSIRSRLYFTKRGAVFDSWIQRVKGLMNSSMVTEPLPSTSILGSAVVLFKP